MVKKHEFHSKMGAKHHVVMTEAQYKRHMKATAKAGHKGAKSKTHKGDLDFTSKRGSLDHHLMGHDVKEKKAPFARKRRTIRRRNY